MAYTINLTDGTIFATIADGTINTSSSMILVGKNYAGYGEFLDENFIHLLENGANTTPPGAPLTGQLWWDKTNGVMKAYNGTVFKTIGSATSSATAPTSNERTRRSLVRYHKCSVESILRNTMDSGWACQHIWSGDFRRYR